MENVRIQSAKLIIEVKCLQFYISCFLQEDIYNESIQRYLVETLVFVPDFVYL